jgi:hypothetical protein
MDTFVSMLSPVKEHSTTSFKMTFIVFPLAIRLALFPIQQTDRTSFLEDGRVKWLTPYPNRNPNCNLNQINNKNPKRNNFRKSLGRFAGWEIVRTLVGCTRKNLTYLVASLPISRQQVLALFVWNNLLTVVYYQTCCKVVPTSPMQS